MNINFLKKVPASNKVIALIWDTDILNILCYKDEDKIKLTQMICEKSKSAQ